MSCYFDIFDLGGTKAVWGYFGAYSSVVEQYIDNVFVRGSNPLRLKRYAFGIPQAAPMGVLRQQSFLVKLIIKQFKLILT